MNKKEMINLLRSVGCDENTVTAMANAYDLGFEQGAMVGDLLRAVVEEAVKLCDDIEYAEAEVNTKEIRAVLNRLKSLNDESE